MEEKKDQEFKTDLTGRQEPHFKSPLETNFEVKAEIKLIQHFPCVTLQNEAVPWFSSVLSR